MAWQAGQACYAIIALRFATALSGVVMIGTPTRACASFFAHAIEDCTNAMARP